MESSGFGEETHMDNVASNLTIKLLFIHRHLYSSTKELKLKLYKLSVVVTIPLFLHRRMMCLPLV